jgi:hypothetical protein
MTDLVKVDWKPADSAYGRGQQAYIEFGQELAKLVKSGVKQTEISLRYDMSEGSVSAAISVGAEKRFANSKALPKSVKALYLLTTLDDKGFAELAKPDTTQAKIQEYKRRLAPPPPAPLVPPKNAVTLEKPVERPTAEQVREAFKSQRSSEIEPSYTKDLSWAFAVFGVCGTPKISMESLDAIYRVLAAKRHPDRSGGDASAMSDLNTARLLIVENNVWVR